MNALSFSLLGRYGRWGNQLFEYAFTRIMAERHGRQAQFPADWVGRTLFGLDDPAVPTPCPYSFFRELTYSREESPLVNGDLISQCPALDIAGVFQYHTSFYQPYKDLFRKWFTPMERVNISYSRGGDMVAIHLRRGDYGRGAFFIPPNDIYLRWLDGLWPTLKNPVLFIASDDVRACAHDFAKFSPVHVSPDSPSWWMDFQILMQADHLAISNSTFSFTAAMLNTRASTFMRPQLTRLGAGMPGPAELVPFDPWDSEPLLHRELGMS